MRGAAQEDLRFSPAYDLGQAARILRLPLSNVRNWFCGANGGRPVLDLASKRPTYVSFAGLTEAYILSSLRKRHRIPLQRIRSALAYLKRTLREEHPLLTRRFKTDGVDLFIEHLGDVINASQEGQTAMKHVMELYLSRIEYGRDGLPVRFRPFTQSSEESDPSVIVVDPRIAFGRPMLGMSGITTEAVAARFKAGESVTSLAKDFERPPQEIEAAIRSELELDTAA
jgi:uncharacterized protein (DUF433 family)